MTIQYPKKKQEDAQEAASGVPIVANEPAYSLQVRQADGRRWTFNYAYFVYAEAVPRKLTIVFSSHRVTVEGPHVEGLSKDVGEHRVTVLRERHETVPSPSPADQIIIEKVTIEVNGDG